MMGKKTQLDGEVNVPEVLAVVSFCVEGSLIPYLSQAGQAKP